MFQALTKLGRLPIWDRLRLELASEHWPGPLTIVAPLEDDSAIASLVTAGLPTIAVRVPRHRAIQALLVASRLGPLAAPSANASGVDQPDAGRACCCEASAVGSHWSSTTAPLPGGIESTIVAEAETAGCGC
jgi:L-threonylcarbamoyladenylate synthase